MQCYSPATGQSLGLVNPVTPDGIDRIVAKAAKAQQTWAKSSFAERRQVLKSLLKYVCSHQEVHTIYTNPLDFCSTTKIQSCEQHVSTVAKLASTPSLVRSWSLLRSSSGCRNPSVQFQGLTSLCPLCVGIHQGRPTGLSTDLQARSVSDAI